MLATPLLILALAAPSAGSGTSADVSVTVTDPSGGRIPGATVEIDPGSAVPLTAVTGPQGEVVLAGVTSGERRVRVTIAGFEPWEKKVRVRNGRATVEARLKLAKLAEDVSVTPDESGSASTGYKTTLTAADIANLPDDPDELEAALRGIAGPQAMMRVNGFSGGRLPPKSQIRQIRFVMNPYAAEFHESQPVFIDVQTKPGLGDWARSTRFGFRDESLNSRSPLAPSRVPDSYRRFGFDLSGPLVKGRTSLNLSAEGRLTDTARTIRAQTSTGGLSQLADSSTDRIDVSARLEHAWGKTHTLRGEFETQSRNEAGLGIGGLDLPERGYEQDRRETTVRFADNGVIFGKVASEQRFRARFETLDFTSNDPGPSIRVMGAFGAGGAGITGGRTARDLEWASNFDLSVGKKHALRAGFLLRHLKVTTDEQRNAAGAFTFADLASYEAGRPSLFSRRVGDPRLEYSHREIGAYVQDEARLTKNLTVSAGLRAEGQPNVGRLFNLAPRVGLTYSPNPKTTIRTGAGRFFGWYDADVYEQALRLDGTHEVETTLSNPSWPDPLASAGGGVSRTTRLIANPDLALPRTTRASFGVERNLVGRLRLNVDYSYQRGSNELRSRNRSVAGSAESLREIEATARSRRHVIDARLNLMPQPNARIGFFFGYLWQDAKNETSGALSLPADERNIAAEWGRAQGDIRHRFFGLLNGRPAKNFSFSSLISASSGAPFDMTTGRDDNGDSLLNDRPAGLTRNAGQAPGRFNVDLRLGWSKSFGAPRAPRPGGGMRVVRIGDNDGAPDMSDPGEAKRYRLSIYLQAFNALNHTNPIAVGTVFGSPLYGQPILAEPGRRIELGTSISF